MNRIKTYFKDARCNIRVQENQDITWSAHNDEQACGHARVRNISMSGMLVETDNKISPEDEQLFKFTGKNGSADFLPQSGRVVWNRPKGFLKKRSLWGIRFDDVAEDTLLSLRQRIQGKVKKDHGRQKIIFAANVGMIVMIVVLMAAVFLMSTDVYKSVTKSNSQLFLAVDGQGKLTRHYSQKYQETRKALEVVSAELTDTKIVLDQTKQTLAEAQAESANLQQQLTQIQSTDAALAEQLRQTIASLNAQNSELSIRIEEMQTKFDAEVSELTKRLRYYEGDIESTEEGKRLLKLYKDRMRMVKNRLGDFKRDAEKVRKQALAERDRVRMVLGNNGYLMKNGQTVKVDEEKYQAGRLDILPSDLQIDVRIVE